MEKKYVIIVAVSLILVAVIAFNFGKAVGLATKETTKTAEVEEPSVVEETVTEGATEETAEVPEETPVETTTTEPSEEPTTV